MSARIIRQPRARRDVIEIGLYLKQHSVVASGQFLRAVEKALQQLAAMPRLGSLSESDHPALAGLRLWSIRGFQKYVILYRPLADGIEVVRVVHGARDIESLFGD